MHKGKENLKLYRKNKKTNKTKTTTKKKKKNVIMHKGKESCML